MKWYLYALRNFTFFSGRSSRTEYWMFVLFNTMFAILFYSLDLIFKLGFEKLGFGPLYLLYILFAFIPGLALTVRRLHDVGRKGLFILIALLPVIGSIWLLVLFLTKSDDDENDYGEKPINSDVAEFINDDKTNTYLLVLSLIWLFINKIFWSITSKYMESLYQNEIFKHCADISNLGWLFFPILLSLSIKTPKWKIIFLVFSVIYMVYGFYEIVRAHILTSDNFQF